MKTLGVIKKTICLIILIVALISIIGFTVYTLNTSALRTEVTQRTKKVMEKISTNETETNISEIYNIYLNKEKLKVKIEYQNVLKDDGKTSVILYVYIDGKSVLESEVINNAKEDIRKTFAQEDVNDNVRITIDSFKIMKDESNDYLLLEIGNIESGIQKYYYIMDNKGKLLNDSGILIYDSSKTYMNEDDEVFINYYDITNQTLARYNDDMIFAFEENIEGKKVELNEYKYYIMNGELVKELVKTYSNLTIRNNE